MDEIKYECCFCGQTVSTSERSSKLDPCSILLTGHFDRHVSEQKEQQFFCHFECIKKAFKADDDVYLDDDELRAETGAML